MQTFKECRIPIQYASFDTFKAKIGWLFAPQSSLKFPRDLWLINSEAK